MIGALNEGQLHRQLKDWYRRSGDLLEQPVDSYVIDIVRGDTLIEIQTGGFTPSADEACRDLPNEAWSVVARSRFGGSSEAVVVGVGAG